MYELLPQINDFPDIKIIPSSSSSQQIPPHFLKAAIFAGGDFQVLEAAFGIINGVNRTSTGYFGGSIRKPSYKDVSECGTGHTEAVKVSYDSRIISFSSLCDLFWDIHDPTNKDYLNFGLSTHKRSVIFYSTEEERKEAQESKIRKQMRLNKRIVTKILSNDENWEFFFAENQYQKYYLQKYYKLCGSLGLRSTLQFVESNIACKLNGILGMSDEQIVDELTIFLEIQDLPNHARSDCEEIIEDFSAIRKK